MFLTSVIIVLREVLEAVMVLSLFLAISYCLLLRWRWLAGGLLLGTIGAVLFGLTMDRVSDALDGVGQEVVNATLQISIFPLLVAVVYLFARQMQHGIRAGTPIVVLMALSAALAVTREGSEIIVFFSGFAHAEGFFNSVAWGALVGAAIGVSIGVLVYYLIVIMSPRFAAAAIIFMLCFVAAGMSAQGAQQLIQADWLASSSPVWDSSGLIPETSVVGQLLYAVIGYEATPSAIELIVYVASLLIVAIGAVFGRAARRPNPGTA